MTNGEMLKELRNLAATEGGLKTSSAIRLICSAQADMMEMIDGLSMELANNQKNQASELLNDNSSILSLNQGFERMSESIQDIKGKIDIMCLNPVIKVGAFVKANPKLSAFLLIFLLVLSNLWFIEEFRSAILQWVGVPLGVIALFNHVIITPAP